MAYVRLLILASLRLATGEDYDGTDQSESVSACSHTVKISKYLTTTAKEGRTGLFS